MDRPTAQATHAALTAPFLFDAHEMRNMPVAHIARVIGCDEDDVREAFARYGITERREIEDAARRGAWHELLTVELLEVEHYDQGRDVAAIARRYGMRYEDVTACFAHHGLEIADPGDPPADPRPVEQQMR